MEIVPARPGKPRDKAKAKVTVQVVQRSVSARLRRETHFSLESLNARIAKLLDELNARPMKHLGASLGPTYMSGSTNRRYASFRASYINGKDDDRHSADREEAKRQGESPPQDLDHAVSLHVGLLPGRPSARPGLPNSNPARSSRYRTVLWFGPRLRGTLRTVSNRSV